MVTRSKTDIYKPKIKSFFATIILHEPQSYKAKGILEGERAKKAEHDVLVKNKIWSLVPKPKG